MYIFIREDISIPQMAVQSCHAAIECANNFGLKDLPDHPSVIILAVKDEAKLHQVRKYLIENGVQHVHFYETDMDDQLTALACEPISGDKRRLFRKFQLLKTKVGAK